MKKRFINISSLIIFSFLSFNLSAQYGPQFDNRDFEQWTTRGETAVSEPVHWHSGGTATGSLAGFLSNQVEVSTQIRPGSSGIKSVRIFPTSVMGITANGTLTNGRINAGSMLPTGTGNYNYTQRSNTLYNTPLTQLPDSLSIWVCFRSSSTSNQAQVKAVVHGDADYKIIANGTEDPANMHVATAEQSFTRTSTANGNYNWQRLSIPFNNNGPCTDVHYILLMATTNKTPAAGSTNDDLFVDDVLLVYNPILSMGQLASNQLTIGSSITIPFTLEGTMSPENLNAEPNEVIAQLSDANGNFESPTELGRITTNTSGSITAVVPNLPEGTNYCIRVVSTNYPMVGQNAQVVSIMGATYTITATANPSDGGTVSGGGTYTYGQTCTLTATANTGYVFLNWTLPDGELVSTEAEFSFTVVESGTYIANFEEISNIEQTIELAAGWNWVSTNVEITLDDLKAALVEALPDTQITINSQSNGSATYNGTRWRGALNSMDLTQMYMVEVTAACELVLEGVPLNPAEHPVTIHQGANWIAFPLSQNMTVIDAFAGFAINGDMVISQSGTSTYNGTRWRGQLSSLEAGKGYIYNSTTVNDRTLVFPSNAK